MARDSTAPGAVAGDERAMAFMAAADPAAPPLLTPSAQPRARVLGTWATLILSRPH
jgi:hypothetical protein